MKQFYFIGVTTGSSSMMRIFPQWMNLVGIDSQIVGIDVPLESPPQVYRDIVQRIKSDPDVVGGLVTSHKINVFNAAHDLFDSFDDNSLLCREMSVITKRGELRAVAGDPVMAGYAWREFIALNHFRAHNADVLCLGSGGAAVAIAVHVCRSDDHPRRFLLVDVNRDRLEHAHHIARQLGTGIQFDTLLNADPLRNDALMSELPPYSLVINASGLGKDRPGSPITDAGVFPKYGIAWELNYRGALDFLHQARRQAESRHLMVADGWRYFLHGWAVAVSLVFGFELTPQLFEQFADTAGKHR
jgi:shikimate dehydrogenase